MQNEKKVSFFCLVSDLMYDAEYAQDICHRYIINFKIVTNYDIWINKHYANNEDSPLFVVLLIKHLYR